MGSADFYNASLRGLVILFVLAVLLESALAVIFNWRLFLEFFYGRGVRTLVMIVVSAAAVWAFKIDVLATMLKAFGLAVNEEETFSRAVTALILAGGSAGVYRILVALGYREEKKPEDVVARPPRNKAWVAIRAIRQQAVGPIEIRVQKRGAVDGNSPPALAGMIGSRRFWPRLRGVFLLDPSRFPPAGGYEVLPDFEYQILVTGMGKNGDPLAASVIDKTYTFAGSAIIDLEVRR
jgi:hypothetical protein